VHAALQAGASLLVPGLMEELEGQLKELEQAELDSPPQAEGERGRAAPKAPANPLAMSIVMVGAECAPWSKTGGLGDVMQALPKALAARGHRLMVVAPMYKRYPEARDTGVRLRLLVCGSETEVAFWHARLDGVDYAFLDHPAFSHWADQIYGGSRQEVLYRCALLSKAALEAPRLLPGGEEGPLGEGCVFVANDFHTALVPVYLQAHYRDHGQMLYARSLLVVHNLAHQGRGPPEELGMLDLPDPYCQLFSLRDAQSGSWMMNVLKAGAIASHRIVAVSNQ
jgi:starch synthase